MASSENEDFIDDDPRIHDSGTHDLEGKLKQMLQQQAEPAAVTSTTAKPRGSPTPTATEYGPDVTGNDINNSNQEQTPNHNTCYEVDADVRSTAAGKASSSSISSSILPRVLENLEHIKTW
jgi:hypothetical protein